MKLIPDWRLMWRSWSVRLNALGLAILAIVAVDPVMLLSVWNMMPAAVRDLVPTQLLSAVGAALFGLSMLARIVRQPKLEEKRDAVAKQ